MRNHNNSNDVYWLADDGEKLVNYLCSKHDTQGSWSNSPFRRAWVRNYLAYYSPILSLGSRDTSLILEGLQGELVRMYTPKARTYVRDLTGIVTKQRLAVQAMCETDGKDVFEDVKLANALCDQIIQNTRLDIKAKSLVEGSLVTGAWFTKTLWRTDMGEPYTATEKGQIIFTGGVDISLVSPFNCFYDTGYGAWDNVPWAEARVVKNRWDLIAQHPELEREIKELPAAIEESGPHVWFDRHAQDYDKVFVYEFFAKPSPSVPKGRIVMYSTHETIYHDGPNETGELPIEPMMPEIVLDTTVGYPKFTNLMAAQEMFDNSLSAIATNQSQFAVQNVAIPRGAGISVQELGGMRFLSFTPQDVQGGGLPTPIQLTQSSPETFKFADILDRYMQEMSGVGGALKGNLPSGVTSGVAIATLSANALEFTEDVGLPYRTCIEKTMSHCINAYKAYAKLPQEIKFKGNNSKVSSTKFSGTQLKTINGIKIITANPLMQTTAGRLEISDKLMQMPKELWPKYTSVLEGRPLTDVYKNELSQEDLIENENEDLIAGKQVFVLATDDHAAHIREHATPLNDPSVRRNSQVINGILAHMEEHLNQAKTVDPFLTAMVRTGKAPEQGPPPPGGGGPGGPGGPGGAPGAAGPPPPGAGGPPTGESALSPLSADTPAINSGAPERANPAVDALARPVIAGPQH